MTCELICVDPARVAEIWPHVRGLIAAAMQRGDLGAFAPVERSVLHGDALLWLAWDGERINAAAVTELAVTEWRKVCVIVACAGTGMSHWLDLIERIENFARAEGCAATRIVGRAGWGRVLKNYRRKCVVLERSL